MTGPQGHPPKPSLRREEDLRRNLALVLQRARWAGRGWPLRVLIEGGLKVTGAGTVRLGDGVRLNRGAWLHAEGGAELVVGAGSSVGRSSQLSALSRVEIGTDVLISPGVVVMDHAHGAIGRDGTFTLHALQKRGPIRIGSDCWVGAYACVLSAEDEELVIGPGSVIGAGAIVTGSVPAGSLVVGPRSIPRPRGSRHDGHPEDADR